MNSRDDGFAIEAIHDAGISPVVELRGEFGAMGFLICPHSFGEFLADESRLRESACILCCRGRSKMRGHFMFAQAVGEFYTLGVTL